MSNARLSDQEPQGLHMTFQYTDAKDPEVMAMMAGEEKQDESKKAVSDQALTNSFSTSQAILDWRQSRYS
jgi:hypothetical protein